MRSRRHSTTQLRAAIAAALVVLMLGGPAASAAPASTFASVLSEKDCIFTLTSTWRRAAVDAVQGTYYLDVTTVAYNSLHNGVKGTRDITRTYVQVPTPGTSHAWQGEVVFFGADFVELARLRTNVVSAECAL